MQRYNYSPKPPTFLSINKQNFSSVILCPHREMHPDSPVAILGRAKRRSRALLNQQLIKLLLRFIRIIEENSSIAKRLLDPSDLNIHRTSCKMVTRSRPANLPIQLRAAIPRVNAYGCPRPLSKNLQPPAQSLQIS